MMAMHRMWGRSAEKFEPQGPLLFDELVEAPAPPEEPAAEAEKKPSNRGRKPLSPRLVRKHHQHDLPEADRMCPCGKCMVKIGEDTNEKLNMIPAQVWVDCHHYSKYGCPDANCPASGDDSRPGVLTAPGPLPLIQRSIVTAALLAHIWTAKFCDHLPFYRQEAGFRRLEVDISNQDMGNWTKTVTDQLAPVVELLEKAIREEIIDPQEQVGLALACGGFQPDAVTSIALDQLHRVICLKLPVAPPTVLGKQGGTLFLTQSMFEQEAVDRPIGNPGHVGGIVRIGLQQPADLRYGAGGPILDQFQYLGRQPFLPDARRRGTPGLLQEEQRALFPVMLYPVPDRALANAVFIAVFLADELLLPRRQRLIAERFDQRQDACDFWKTAGINAVPFMCFHALPPILQ
jgi:transposase